MDSLQEIQKQGEEILDLKLEIQNLKFRLQKVEALISDNSFVSKKRTRPKSKSLRRGNRKHDDSTESAVESDGEDSEEDYKVGRPSHNLLMKGSIPPMEMTTSDRVARRLTDAFDIERNIGSNAVDLSERSTKKRRSVDRSKIKGTKVEKMFNYIGTIQSYNGDVIWTVKFEDGDILDLDENDIIDSLARFDEHKGKKSSEFRDESPSSSLKESYSRTIEGDPMSVVGLKIMKGFLVDGEVVSFIGDKFGVSFINGTILEMSLSDVEECTRS